RKRECFAVSLGRPAIERSIGKQVGLLVMQDEDTGRKVDDGFSEGYLFPAAIDALFVQHFVDLPDRGSLVEAIFGIGADPEYLEAVERLPPAFGAGTVTRGEGGGLVEKEEFGIPVRCHDLSSSSLEVEQADQPCF